MATFSELITLFNTLFPDTGRMITPGDQRQAFTACAAFSGGVPSISLTIASAGSNFTDSRAIGHTVDAIMINDAPKNTGFGQPNGSGTIAFTDSTTVAVGDVVTVFFA